MIGLVVAIAVTWAQSDCPKYSYTAGSRTGPANWSTLCLAYSACSGTRQSPVDIQISNSVEAEPIKRLSVEGEERYNVSFDAEDNLKITFHPRDLLTVDDETNVLLKADYELIQFHLHAPSDHTINGRRYDAELHLVHQRVSNSSAAEPLAVMALLYEESRSESPLLRRLLSLYNNNATGSRSFDLLGGDYSDLKKQRVILAYKGSLTSPPCAEIVQWVVFRNGVSASRAQLTQIANILGVTGRPTQPLNGRVVNYHRLKKFRIDD